jgi:hypothetical protein
MDNSYTSQYMPNGFEDANQQGLNPVFQNTNTQQQYLNQQLGQGNQYAQPHAQTGYSGMNPMALASMLRKDPNAPQGNSLMDRAAAYFGTSNTPEMQAQVSQLGSNTYNPMSDYNLGTNGWGSFGE